VSHNPQLIQTAYAFQPCPREIVNPIDPNSINITLDKDFIFKNDTIRQGTSLLSLEGVQPESYSYIDYEYGMDISFDSTFLSKSTFNNEWYKFTISMMNYDTIAESFIADISLYMNTN